ncbi:MAG TPA: ABC transporter substrate-binding protein [Ilumatobacteraceae bacterium]|nr:ABC transporter substrate-binding protein [Ilumatobacteraceae bacterium]
MGAQRHQESPHGVVHHSVVRHDGIRRERVRREPRRRRAAALSVMVAAALTACSSSGQPSSSGANSTTTVGSTAPAASSTEASTVGSSAVEITQVVRVGYAYPDLKAFSTLNKELGIGDPELQAEAVVDGWRRDGLLPPGMDVEVVYAPYNILSNSEKLGACTTLAQDEDVFAVVSGLTFTTGAECLATRFGIPVIDTEGAPRSLYERGAPWLFTLRADQVTQFGNYGRWLVDSGVLEGKRVGLYFETPLTEGVDAMRAILKEAGIDIVSTTESTGVGIGSTEDEVSVRRFIEDKVDVVLPLVGGSSAVNMYNFAEAQDFHPEYYDLDTAEHTTDVAARTNPTSQYDGTTAMTMTRIGELAGGVDNSGREACMANYERYAAQDLSREPPESGELSSILRTCDLFAVLLAGLHGAAADLTRENFVTALENSGEIELVGSANGSFSATDHSLIDEYRSIQWDAACPCWRAISDFQKVSVID